MEISVEINVDETFMAQIEHDKLNSLDLRSDIENNNIFGGILVSSGYVGNRPEIFNGNHPDDTWAIDLYVNDTTESAYLYTSEFEYNEDLEMLKQFI